MSPACSTIPVPSPSYSITIRVEIENRIGMFARIRKSDNMVLCPVGFFSPSCPLYPVP